MSSVTLSAMPNGNGYQASMTFPHGVEIASAKTYPTVADAIAGAAMTLLNMPERLEALDEQVRID